MTNTRLKDIRENKDLHQKDIAKILKISQPVYARYETGERFIPLNKLREYCNYFNTSMDYIFNLNDKNNFKKIKELDKKEIGNKLKQIRKEKNLTQQDIADLLNTTRSTICAYEKGYTLILTAFLYSLCKNLELSMDEICQKK